MRRWMLGIALVAVALGGVGMAHADYADGQQAWDAGRRSEALREWQAAANAGDAKAMLTLGCLHMEFPGMLGYVQSYEQANVQAYVWFSLAASRFEAGAVKERDALAARMSPEQVAKAQEQAARKPAGAPPPKAIREAQELLAALDYEPDPPDGQWGMRTAQAYLSFVRDVNLPVTGTLTPAALKAMRARARQVGAESTPKPKAALRPDALHRAAKAGNLKGLEAALSTGVDVNVRDDKGWTALMYVVDKGYVLLVESLLQAKADPDVRAPDGAMALFMAAAHGHGEIISLLMRAGADPAIKGPKGKTAAEVAQARYGEPEAAQEKGESAEIVALLAGKTWEAFSFDRAQSLGTVEAYAEYIESYSSGRHIDEARWRQVEREQPFVPLTTASPAGTTGRDCAVCPEMIVVPAGRFRMGSGDSDERPVHDVTIDDPFAVGRYEVTFAEWDACVAAGGCTHRPDDEGWGRGARPVINVSFNDALEYVRWLSRKTGNRYRFLTAEEWEYVARAGTTMRYWWGNEIGTNKANCDGCGSRWDNKSTAPVGSFEANAFGLFDTAGNVWEWVADYWSENNVAAPADGSAWTGGGDTACEPFRHSAIIHHEHWGGSWRFSPRDLRLGIRYYIEAGSWDGGSDNGIRVARTLD